MDVNTRNEKLQEYRSETSRYIQTVRTFCLTVQKWCKQRKIELKLIKDIKRSADKFFGGFKKQKLEKKLGAVLIDTVEGLNELQKFLDALERLAVTSVFVFKDESVRSVISTARDICPLLIHFKRDARAFFMPILDNAEVLACQLDKYIYITEQICKTISGKTLEIKDIQHDPSLEFGFSIRDSVKNTIDHLSKMRMDESFRMSFLFSTNNQHFIDIYSECRPRMLQFLSDLEESAVQLDKMKMGSSISTVAGSSVGIAGGVLSIVGLALAPVTAGVSLALTLTGVGLGVTSGVNSLVTGVTEMAVNKHHGKNANNIFQNFMKDVQRILDCLEQASMQNSVPQLQRNNVEKVVQAGKVMKNYFTVLKQVDSIVDGASALKNLRSEEVARRAITMGLHQAKAGQRIPSLAADLPDIGNLAKGTPLALSKTARAGFITANALFIGLDVFMICKESLSLAKGDKSRQSQLIRSRSALWKTEIESWEKIHDSLCKGKETFQDNKAILEQSYDD